MILRVGQTLAGPGDSTTVVVVRTPARDLVVTCGGAEMRDAAAASGGGSAESGATGTQIGKRYVDPDGELELLCIKAGAGELAADGAPLHVKAAKSLPASD